MEPLGNNLCKKFRITILDLPGFGESDEPKEALTIYDYADVVKRLLDKLKIKNPILIGHSFGGRIAIVYASKYETEKVVLLGAPCVREKEKESLKVKMLKKLKKVPVLSNFEEFAKKHIGSEDYKNASPIMREILVNTVNEDLTGCALKINCPTLLIWGTNDTEAPLEDAKKLEKYISGPIVDPWTKVEIPLEDVKSCSITDDSRSIFDKTIRTWGSGGMYGCLGHFRHSTYGKMRMFVTHMQQCFLIRMKDGRNFVVSSPKREEIVKFVCKCIK